MAACRGPALGPASGHEHPLFSCTCSSLVCPYMPALTLARPPLCMLSPSPQRQAAEAMAQLAEASAQAQAMMDQLAVERERSALLEVRPPCPPGAARPAPPLRADAAAAALASCLRLRCRKGKLVWPDPGLPHVPLRLVGSFLRLQEELAHTQHDLAVSAEEVLHLQHELVNTKDTGERPRSNAGSTCAAAAAGSDTRAWVGGPAATPAAAVGCLVQQLAAWTAAGLTQRLAGAGLAMWALSVGHSDGGCAHGAAARGRAGAAPCSEAALMGLRRCRAAAGGWAAVCTAG